MVEVAAVGDQGGAIHDLTPRRGFTIIEGRAIDNWAGRRDQRTRSALTLSIVEIIVILVVALIVIPPENLPDVMRAAGKILRELRLASNMVKRELGGALDQQPAERTEPSVNTMKPDPPKPHTTMQPANVATSATIAQSDASAEGKTAADSVASAHHRSTAPGEFAAETGTSTVESAPADVGDKPITQS
jgi:Sec-independent protein translocase protein TatA